MSEEWVNKDLFERAKKLEIARKMIRKLASKGFYTNKNYALSVDDPDHPLAGRVYRMAVRVLGEIQ